MTTDKWQRPLPKVAVRVQTYIGSTGIFQHASWTIHAVLLCHCLPHFISAQNTDRPAVASYTQIQNVPNWDRVLSLKDGHCRNKIIKIFSQHWQISNYPLRHHPGQQVACSAIPQLSVSRQITTNANFNPKGATRWAQMVAFALLVHLYKS